MSMPQNVIAVVFDFDDTLTDDSTTKLLEAHDIDPVDFWGKLMKERADAGWDPPLAYLTWILENVGESKPFGLLTNDKLRKFGESLQFYPGIPELFGDLKAITEEHPLTRPAVEFYIVSGGLEEIIRGSSVTRHFNGIWACTFAEESGVVRFVKNSITFTEKTKALFAINKGITDAETRKHPYAVNEDRRPENRRVPFKNMIYLGDGLTDVPCFSLLNHFEGTSFGIFDPKKTGSPKKAWEKLIAPKRVNSVHSPRYGKDDDLGALVRAAVKQICLRLDLQSRGPLAS